MQYRYGNRRWLVLAAAVTLAGFAAACGGSGAAHKTAGSVAGTTGGGAARATGDTKAESAARDSAGGSAALAAAQPNGSGAAAGGETPALPSQLDRKMIIVATVDVTVDDVSRGFEDVGNIAALAGGFVSSSAFGHNGDKQTASVTIRVPADRYQDTVNRIRKLGNVRDEQANASDVTEQYTDLQSRLRNLQATEQTYLGFLGRAGDITQVLTVQDRINSTRAEIEQVQGRINLMQNQTDLATVTVHLDPPAIVAPKAKSASTNPLEVARDSFAASLVVLRNIATVGLATVAFGWWLLPLIAAGWYLARSRATKGSAPRAG